MSMWTEERVELLKKLWPQGLSARQIATRLGDGVTKNAVLGKVMRLVDKGEMIPRGDPAGGNRLLSKRPKPKSQSPWRALQVLGDGAKRGIKADGFVPPVDTPAPLHQRKSVVTLEKDDCRWPIGDPLLVGFHFCGAEKVPGLPYCGQHAARAYQPPKTRVVREIEHMPTKETENA